MASTYSKLKIELIGTGDQAGQWGTTTNNNLGSSSAGVYRGLEQAIVGMATISSGFVANSYTLPYTNSNDDQEFRCLVLNITASLSNPSDLIVPAIQKPYIVINSSGQTVTVKVSGQTGVAVPNGAKILLYNTGTDVGTAITYLTELKLGGNLTMPSAGSINDSNGNELIKFPSAVASAVNELTISNAATGSAPTLSATGNDTNIGITLTPKGTGTFLVTGNTTLGDSTTDTITLTGTVQPGVVISGSSSGDALRITQTGAGNALLVEDSANPDSSPFVVTAAGDVGIGTSSPTSKFHVEGAVDASIISQTVNTSTGTSAFAQVNAQGNDTTLRLTAYGSNHSARGSTAWLNVNEASRSLVLATGNTERMRLDSSGNLGLGVAPSAWATVLPVLQANNASFTGYNNQAALSSNYYYNAGNKYIASGYATQYSQSSGQHIWYTAPSGTAGAAISFTQAMTLDASGNLAVGTTSYRTPASYTAFALNGTVGSLIDLYAGGTRYGGLATISSAVTLSSITSIPLVFSTNDTERARITSGGDFFIGNGETAASPSAGILSATGGTGTNIAGANLTIRGGASTGTGAGGVIIFSTAAASGTSGTATNSATERARITSGGDLLVGTTDSSGMSGAGFKTLSGRPVVVNAASANTTAVYDVYSTGGSAYRFYVGMGGTIYATSTTITAISDQRLKENIQDIDVGLDKIMALKPRKFDWKEGKGKDKKGDRGWIAQEFEQVFPDMITTWKDEPPEGEEPYKAVNADLIPVLVKAIQEQQTLITSLTARVAALEGTQP